MQPRSREKFCQARSKSPDTGRIGTAYTISLPVPIIVIGLALTVFAARLVLIAVRGNPGSQSLRTD